MKSQIDYIGQEKISKKGKPYSNISFTELNTLEEHKFVMVFGEEMLSLVSQFNIGDIVDIEVNKNFLNDIRVWTKEIEEHLLQLDKDKDFVIMYNNDLVFLNNDYTEHVSNLIHIQELNMFVLGSESRYHGLVIEVGDEYRVFLKDGIKTSKLLKDLH